ncbi:uncharacterized protein [Henckelia pumila]|uniref:uncharacterized protein n=1 Tax=Henckelia pumila TaxID=405737 RepID=UPI003C6E428A
MADNEKNEAAAELIGDDVPRVEEAKDLSPHEDPEEMASPKQEEEILIKKKYGGLLPRKPPLISNDKEHAFFDSADWALGKAGSQKSKGPLEALRPKLQPTPHQQARSISAYAPANDDDEESMDYDTVTHEEQRQSPVDPGFESRKNTTENQNQPN